MNDKDHVGSPRSLRARWVFPVAGSPLANAAVTIADGQIVAVGTAPNDVPVEDLGDVALVPGLVNAHTHLEFSDLAGPIGQAGMNLVQWLRSVMEYRAEGRARVGSPIVHGLAESIRYGVTTVGEIAQPGIFTYLHPRTRCEGTLFMELIAPTIERVAPVLGMAREHLRTAWRAGTWQHGLSPHAPYTVHPELLAGAVALSVEYHAPLAMHLAESLEEIEFLRDGSGRFRELLESRRVYDPAARPLGSRALDELRVLSQAHRAIVIHGNYLDAEEIEFVGQHNQRMAVVYCPRTHAWFDHAPYPLAALLAAGAVVALGTDSRASAPDLSLLAEMRHVARSFPKLSRATILELGTLGGARVLGRQAEIGTLQPGKWANLAAIRLPDAPADDPHELLLDADGPVVGTWIRGQQAV